jgi:SAM-dependent methyltransferase
MGFSRAVQNDFDENFMVKRKYLHWRAPHIVDAIIKNVKPFKTVIDVGCATGDLVNEFLKSGKDAFGADASQSALDHFAAPTTQFIPLDLTDHLQAKQRYDLVLCVETLSIMEPEHHQRALINLCSMSNRIILCVGQGKRHDIEPTMAAFLYKRNEKAEAGIRDHLEFWRNKLAIKAFYNGLMVWERMPSILETCYKCGTHYITGTICSNCYSD